jgi:hypothetical protein
MEAKMRQDFGVAEINEDTKSDVLIAVYAEICKSYHAIDDFRTKLLGFLPLTSLVGVFLLDREKTILSLSGASNELLGFAAVFAALFTLALFGYELRSIWRSHHLINEGLHIEKQLGIKHGQFHICAGEQCPDEHPKTINIEILFNSKVVACVIYSIVFAAWLFMALRVGLRATMFSCCILAVFAGLILSMFTYQLTKRPFAA